MKAFFLSIFDALSGKKGLAAAGVLAVLALCAVLASRMHYAEDISEFLPSDPASERYSEVYNALSEKGNIVVLFRADTTDQGWRYSVEDAMDSFEENWAAADSTGLVPSRQIRTDASAALGLMSFVGARLPYFLTEDDYRRADSLLNIPGYVRQDQEDTFARVIHFSLEGVGFAYRECVSRSGIDYAAYDRLFSKIDYAYGTDAAAIAMHRLRTPRSMGEAAGARYRSFLEKYVDQTLRDLVRRGDAEGIELLRDEVRIPETERAAAMVYASEQGQTECAALLASMRVADEETQTPGKKTENEDNPPRSSTTAGMLDLEEW